MIYKISLWPLAAGLALSSLFNVAHAAPPSGSLTLNAVARVDGAPGESDPHSASTTGTLGTLSVATSVDLQGVHASGFGTATWAPDGSSGTVHFQQGWKFPNGGGYASFANSGTPVWDYRFTASRAGTLQLDYDVTATGNPLGLQGWSIGWSGTGGGQDMYNAWNPTSSGSFVRDLVAGQSYDLFLQTNANLNAGTAFGPGSVEGTFSFSITPGSVSPVPEPAAPAMFAAGAAAVAFAARRKARSRMA